MSPAVDRVLDALRCAGCDPRPNGKGWKFKCPAHDDKTPSASLAEGEDGRALVLCRAGCECETIVSKVGLTMADLFADTPKTERRIVATYDYQDERGELLYQVVRFDPKDFRQRRPDGRGGWTWKLDDVRRVLYGLPGLIVATAADWTIYLVEGERDADAINHLESGAEFFATCNSGGAGKWRAEYNATLKGARVVIIADKDEPGRRHALDVRASLQGIAASVVIVEAKTGKDAADHLAAGHTLADFVPFVEPGDKTATDASGAFEWIRLGVRDALSPEVKPIPWRETGIAAEGEVITVTAPPGLAKTTILMGLTVDACIGRPGLGVYEVPRPQTALWIDEEMGIEMLSALLTRIVLGKQLTPDEIELLAKNLDIRPQQGLSLGDARQLSVYDKTLRDGRHGIVVMDSMVALTTGKESDANDNRDFYDRCIAPYKGQLKTTFMLAAHPPKPSQQAAPGAQRHARGSGDKIAMVDREFWIEKQSEEITPDSHVLKVILNREKQRRAGSIDGHLIVIDGTAEKPLTVRSLGATGSPTAVHEIGKINAAQHEILVRLRAAPGRRLYQPDLIRDMEAAGYDRRHHYYPAINVLESQGFVRIDNAPAGSGRSGKWVQLLDVDDE